LVRLQSLPKPDWLDFTPRDTCIALLTDDGSLTTPQLAEVLTQQGWNLVVLRFPQSLVPNCVPLPEGVAAVDLIDLSETHLKEQLASISTTYGTIDTFIHLHPQFLLSEDAMVTYLKADKALVQQVFLLAKFLKSSLSAVNPLGRNSWITVTRLDGALGVSQQANFSPISAGLLGLTKSLNQEWPGTFCRAIDLSPDLEAEQSAQLILAEMHDPDLGITEVAYSTQGRTTLVCEFS
jgi:NAD(P)-dependent dehydrogenase (short-subunit alcohol dehydrogenase family)